MVMLYLLYSLCSQARPSASTDSYSSTSEVQLESNWSLTETYKCCSWLWTGHPVGSWDWTARNETFRVLLPLHTKSSASCAAGGFGRHLQMEAMSQGHHQQSHGFLPATLVLQGSKRTHRLTRRYPALEEWLAYIGNNVLFPPLIWNVYSEGM